ncbi:FixH family protein [Algicola sagamiensis]|uniref:FixH family protein n=1 Tax=Algicola sagamiensis TaxID=163869 RepID=UPI000361C03A|nr:FixH family protein [Algicola sagamiensis]
MNQPWYKQFWPWFVFILPATAVVASISTFIIANLNQPAMVIDDYYKEGKAINLELSKYRKALELGVEFQAQIQPDSISFKPKVAFKDETALTLSFFHPTLEEKDFSILLTANAVGQYQGILEEKLSGHWTIYVEPFDKSWKLKKELYLPTDSKFQIDAVPKLNQ